MKRCFKCLCTKPLVLFYKHSAMRDGHLNKCIECTKQDATNYRANNLMKVRQYDRMRASQPHRLVFGKLKVQRWRANHPDRFAAQTALNNAVRDGVVIPWPVCAVPECNDKPHAHHPDYSHPLSVVWLCPAHHAQAHALTKRIAA